LLFIPAIARLTRVVAPGTPHHVTHRGHRCLTAFLYEEDYQAYLDLFAQCSFKREVEVLAYCLISKYVNLIPMLRMIDSLWSLADETLKCYIRQVNFRGRWRSRL